MNFTAKADIPRSQNNQNSTSHYSKQLRKHKGNTHNAMQFKKTETANTNGRDSKTRTEKKRDRCLQRRRSREGVAERSKKLTKVEDGYQHEIII